MMSQQFPLKQQLPVRTYFETLPLDSVFTGSENSE